MKKVTIKVTRHERQQIVCLASMLEINKEELFENIVGLQGFMNTVSKFWYKLGVARNSGPYQQYKICTKFRVKIPMFFSRYTNEWKSIVEDNINVAGNKLHWLIPKRMVCSEPSARIFEATFMISENVEKMFAEHDDLSACVREYLFNDSIKPTIKRKKG